MDKEELKKTLRVGERKYEFYGLSEARKQGLKNIDKLPCGLKILLENLLRNGTNWEDAKAMDAWVENPTSSHSKEIVYYPARVLMQDFTGVPCVADLAAMREAMSKLGGQTHRINPSIQVDLVIDHSVSVEYFATKEAFEKNVAIEYERNMERYKFLKWGQKAFKNFRVVPPGTGIVHQVNLEYLAQVVWRDEREEGLVYPDTLVGTDSHTTMANALSVLGWGVGGIEAEAAMLGQPITMLIPEVIGFHVKGELAEGVTAMDLVLHVVEILRAYGVVGKFVEFFGEGLRSLTLEDRATLANMAPEYGATCGLFPIDTTTLKYLALTGRDSESIALVEAYAKEQGLWATTDEGSSPPVFTDVVELDLGKVTSCLSGPRRPQDRVPLTQAAQGFFREFPPASRSGPRNEAFPVPGESFSIRDGHVAIAAITSCTNTSNPSAMVAAGLLAKKAVDRGLKVKPWVKTSLAPGSKVVTDYLVESGLQQALNQLGFHLVGHGCTTCIGNSGPLLPSLSTCIRDNDVVAASVLSGNRNFEGRINPDIRANYLASPPLVVAYALAGTLLTDLTRTPLGYDGQKKEVFLRDLWPTSREIEDVIEKHLNSAMFKKSYADVFEGDELWKLIEAPTGKTYPWDEESTYIKRPSFFDGENIGISVGTDVGTGVGTDDSGFEIKQARILALLGDSVTTDHISPAGSISPQSPAGEYLRCRGIKPSDFNSYGSRRGNHEVMARGTFANIRIRNEMLPGKEGGYTKHIPTGDVLSIYEAAMRYSREKTPLVAIGGREYGTGSSRDWAAKGTCLLGVKAVIAESFERIHRSNLIGMGVLPLQFPKGVDRKTFNLDGSERISLKAAGAGGPTPKGEVEMVVHRGGEAKERASLICRVDTKDELNYFKCGGILSYVLNKIKGLQGFEEYSI